jgi:prepilin-type N-terminal cleavage/methylation domain-containing protein
MLNKIKKDNQGFTIIEVLIVLAIAGLILLVVFLAVPTLQRNSRNTQIRNAANNVAGAVNEYVGINGGKLPGGFTIASGTVTVSPASGDTGTNTSIKVPGNIVTADITYKKGEKCSGNTSTATGANSRQFTITYNIESSASAANPQCIDG